MDACINLLALIFLPEYSVAILLFDCFLLQPMDLMVEASPRRTFANAHTYHINSISVNSDQQTYMSADDLRINLWHLEITDQSFSILYFHSRHHHLSYVRLVLMFSCFFYVHRLLYIGSVLIFITITINPMPESTVMLERLFLSCD